MHTNKQNIIQEFMTASVTLRGALSKLCCTSLEDKIATILQIQALSYLKDHKNTTVGELGEELAMSSSAVAQLIDRLISAGRIIRTHDKLDRRIVHISLTAEGKKELTKSKKKYMEKMTLLLSHISERDLQEVVRIQKELINKLESSHISL